MCTQAVLIDNFAEIPRTLGKIAMKSAWVHTGALRAPVCIQGQVMAIFARVRGISAKTSMRTAWVHARVRATLALSI